ncbi:Lcl C-terminal domain-containing protein [Quatrionicoccus australiensis]|uniref:Lcl C-terminal domain-containing protein n=1 Tax=Quatrionicoccus australiensis TaxID=138118 RepID=UPI001CF89F26|nr:DUF1566 domain-containing protein [Quatrionicoccus australiensis]UCV13439.1 DUF1566 domain-containing protein [Quatrionicoccus australiensis]
MKINALILIGALLPGAGFADQLEGWFDCDDLRYEINVIVDDAKSVVNLTATNGVAVKSTGVVDAGNSLFKISFGTSGAVPNKENIILSGKYSSNNQTISGKVMSSGCGDFSLVAKPTHLASKQIKGASAQQPEGKGGFEFDGNNPVQQSFISRPGDSSKDDARAQGGVVKIGSLMWMRCSVGQTWTGKYCANKSKGFERSEAVRHKMDYAGYSDWRLPSVAELNSLVRCPDGRSALESDSQGKCLGDRGKIGNKIWRHAYGDLSYEGGVRALIEHQQFPQTPLGDYWTYETDGTWFNYVSFIDGESSGGQNNRAFTRGGVFLRMIRDDYSDKAQVPESDFDIRVKVSAKKADPSSLRHDLGIMQFDSTETSNQIHMSYAISPKAKMSKFKDRDIVLVMNVVVEKDVDLVFMGIGVTQAQPEFKTIKVQLKKASAYAANGYHVLFDIKTFLKMLGGTQQVRNVKPKVSLTAIYYE